jgi:hypothetical protein
MVDDFLGPFIGGMPLQALVPTALWAREASL